MRSFYHLSSAIILVLAVLSSLAIAQADQKEGSNPDEAAIHDYILTMVKVQKYSDVAKKMNRWARAILPWSRK